MERLRHEIRQALRSLRGSPGNSASVVLILGLGIGVATTFFSFLAAAFLRPLPYPAAEELVALNQAASGESTYGRISVGMLRDLRQRRDVFAGVAGYRRMRLRLQPPRAPDSTARYVKGAIITPGLLRLLDVQPVLGTLPEDDIDSRQVVLGYSLWDDAFAADSAVLRRTLMLNGDPARVVGVMPAGFAFPHSEQIWLAAPELLRAAGSETLNGIARLHPDLSIEEARTRLVSAGTWPRLEIRPEIIDRGKGLGVVPWLLFAAGVLVLVLVISNVASLLLVWRVRRRGEVALKLALGAGPGRLVREVLLESAARSASACPGSGRPPSSERSAPTSRDGSRSGWMEPYSPSPSARSPRQLSPSASSRRSEPRTRLRCRS